jgi:3-hydroxyisobutyrate dehydrogenase-like beta-hydroxyacid dehydrogenase
MSEPIKKVAFVGLGRMGAGIANNILKAGFELAVYNRTAAKMRPLVEAGARPSASPREAASGADAVVTCLFDDASVLDTVSGDDGLLAGLPAGAVHIGTTTISPRTADTLAAMHEAHGSHYVAGPVIGRPDVAEGGRLLTLVAGDAAAVSRAEPLIKSYAAAVMNVGERHSAANAAKLALNFMAVVMIELMGEVYAFTEKSGIDGNLVQGLVSSMFGPQPLKDYAKRIFDRDFDEVGFDLVSGLKDVRLMLGASEDVAVPLSLAGVLREKFVAAIANGLGGKDWSAVTEVTRMSAGLQRN